MEKILRIERVLESAERALLAGLLGFMVLLAFLQVALRHVGRWTSEPLSLLWGDTLLRHLVLWLGFLGAALAASRNKQFSMDLSTRLLGGRTRAFSALTCDAFAAMVCAGLLRASIRFFKDEYAQGGILFSAFGVDVPAWTLESIIPGGFALLLVHYALRSLKDLGALRLSR